MTIQFPGRQPAPTIPTSVSEDLPPLLRLLWNRRNHCANRWEIWAELVPNTHSLNRFPISSKDIHLDGSLWRFVQTWQYDDGSFCPLDQRIISSARQADTFRNRRFYEDHVERPGPDSAAQAKELAYHARHRYFNLDNPIVGPATKGSWRHRIR